MSSYQQIFYHLVFGTKDREKTVTEEHCTELYQYIWGIVRNHASKLYRINGVEDHLHLLSDLHPTIALADYVKNIKVANSIWMKESGKFPLFKGWQDGYGAFTCSIHEKERIIGYIKNQ